MLQFFQKYKNHFFVLFLCIGITIFSCHLLQRDIWYDEAYSGIVIRLSWSDLWNKIIHDVHPPLYYLFLKIWSDVFGSLAVSIRLFSLLCQIGSLFVFFQISSFFSKKTAYIATSIVALSPFFLGYATEARMYALLNLFVLSGILYLMKYQFQTRTYTNLILSAIFLSLASLTHYFGLLAFGSALIYLLFANKTTLLIKSTCLHVLSFFIPFLLLFTPWLPFLRGQLGNLNTFGWIPSADINKFPESLAIFFYGNALGTPMGSILHTFPLFLPALLLFTLVIVCITCSNLIKERAVFLLLCFSCIPFIILFITPLFGIHLYLERYLLPFGAVWILLSIFALNKALPSSISSVIFGLYGISILSFYPVIPLHKDYPLLINEIKDIPVIILDNPFDYTVTKFYFPEKRVFLLDPSVNYSGWNIIPAADILTSPPSLDNKIFVYRKGNPKKSGREAGEFFINNQK